ncbi:MAG: 5'-deoxynucleotidase [Oscillospiraceae bacterium]|nr:5'-deoxynucleotidase [Oscillospiraceae bacterium]MBR4691606.1 5'-deoxynucleotidase [Oscillospiraceae bacterium]
MGDVRLENAFFALAARMRNIRRWGLMRNSFEENLLEHAQITAVLAHALAVIRRDVFGRSADPDRAAAAALFHDMSEILTGDLPTPVKYLNEDIRRSYKAVESRAEAQLLLLLPEEMRPAYGELLRGGEGEVHELVKAADKLAAYIKCIEELRAGNQEFRSAEKQIRQTLEASELPEVPYFIERFLPAFGMTLDELTGS